MIPTPLVIERADGPFLFDVDGNRLIDYYLGMGPMILGHNPAAGARAVVPSLNAACSTAGRASWKFAGRRAVSARSCHARSELRFTCSGSEAVQAALRLARAATGRDRGHQVRGPLPRLVRQRAGRPCRHAGRTPAIRVAPRPQSRQRRPGRHRLGQRRGAGLERSRRGRGAAGRGDVAARHHGTDDVQRRRHPAAAMATSRACARPARATARC